MFSLMECKIDVPKAFLDIRIISVLKLAPCGITWLHGDKILKFGVRIKLGSSVNIVDGFGKSYYNYTKSTKWF